jgi:exopolysaccharide biosynthesis polyprenyl glycosylphosphotransferase
MSNRNPSFQIVGTYDVKNESLNNIPTYKTVENLAEALRSGHCDTLLLSSAGMNQKDLYRLIQICENHQVDYQILPTYLDLMASRGRVDLINFVPMLSYSETSITGWKLFYKMFFDFSISLIILLPFLPLWLFIALLIVLDSPGAPIFTQLRVGKAGKKFRIFKFRTMIRDAEQMGPLTLDNDSRITRVGRFLRKYSIDEIPQIINVLLGQMSLIGPRAVVPAVAEQFDEWEKMSLNVLPGITGLAQVYGRNRLSLLDKSFLSIYYIRNYSLILDFKILVRTVMTIIQGTGSLGTLEADRISHLEVEKPLFDISEEK